ncbi:MAG: ribosome biogenesis GTPase Der [Deltaproteobacteria bacterium]|nr:ribosome biogenesis GTPase Der [Deltaproteobacteria bacterium]
MPVVAIVGRPNVGKSTLFNRILGRRKAIVDDTSGVTRDRNYGVASWTGREFTLVDTGGLDPTVEEGFFPLIRDQAMLAIGEADVILFVLDTRDGLTPADMEVADVLRRTEKPVIVVANKSEGDKREMEAAEFFELGLGSVMPVSALHGAGVAELLEKVVLDLPDAGETTREQWDIRVAVIGRPNTGKSTLINRILGEERLLVSEIPGTTMDSIDTLLKHGERHYLFVDTAGVRRRSRIRMDMERHSVMRAISALERCDVCLLLLDSVEGLVEQDIRLAGLAEDRGRGLVVVLNKWDLMEKDHMTFDRMCKDIREQLFFFNHAPIVSLSSLTGMRVGRIFDAVETVYGEAGKKIPTRELNDLLVRAVERHQPPLVRGRRVRFYYATQTLTHPPTFLIFTNRPGEIRENYVKYLEGRIREEAGFAGNPIRLRFRRGRGEGGRG